MNPQLVEKYIPFINELTKRYQYPSNISHLLYVIVPAFVTKYTIYKETLILNTLRDTKIMISSQKSNITEAYYVSIPTYQDKKITTTKYIVIQNYQNISLIQLLDNLVHELNHAIHSYNQEQYIHENILYLRTGLTYAKYSLPNLTPLQKDSSYILEEILNTNQTEEIINIIKSYQSPFTQPIIENIIYALNHEIENNYNSKAYLLETTIFQPILANKTFLSTLNNLRLSGKITDIEEWFDHITGISGSYQSLNNNLLKVIELEKKLSTTKLFKNRIIRQLKSLLDKILQIIHLFNQNCNYK